VSGSPAGIGVLISSLSLLVGELTGVIVYHENAVTRLPRCP